MLGREGSHGGRRPFLDCKLGGNWAQVDIVHDGTPIRTFDTPTYEILGECGPDTVTIGFPGDSAFEMASRNLYGIFETLFDGRHAYVVR